MSGTSASKAQLQAKLDSLRAVACDASDPDFRSLNKVLMDTAKALAVLMEAEVKEKSTGVWAKLDPEDLKSLQNKAREKIAAIRDPCAGAATSGPAEQASEEKPPAVTLPAATGSAAALKQGGVQDVKNPRPTIDSPVVLVRGPAPPVSTSPPEHSGVPGATVTQDQSGDAAPPRVAPAGRGPKPDQQEVSSKEGKPVKASQTGVASQEMGTGKPPQQPAATPDKTAGAKSTQPTCPSKDLKVLEPVFIGDQSAVTVCSDPSARVAILVGGQKVADAVLVGEFVMDSKPVDLTQVKQLTVRQTIGKTTTASKAAVKPSGSDSNTASKATASETPQSPCLTPGANSIPFIVGTPPAVSKAKVVICADPAATVDLLGDKGGTLDTETQPFGVFSATARINEGQTVSALQILSGNSKVSDPVQPQKSAVSQCPKPEKYPVFLTTYPLIGGITDIEGCAPNGSDVKFFVNDSASGTPKVDSDGKFYVHLGKALSAGDSVRIEADKGQTVQSRVFTVLAPTVDWGRVQADFTAGVILSKQNTDFSKTDPYLALHVESNFFQNHRAQLYPCEAQLAKGEQNVDSLTGGCGEGKTGGIFRAAALFSGFFDARLTSSETCTAQTNPSGTGQTSGSGSGGQAQTSSTSQCGSAAENLLTSTSAKEGFVRGGLDWPWFWNSWSWTNQKHRNSLFVAPLAEGGVQTFAITTSPSFPNGQGVYDFFDFGARIGQYTFRGSAKTDPPYWEPSLNSYLDITLGKWANFVQPRSVSGITAVNNNNYFRPWKVGLEGRLTIPATPFVIGFDSTFWHGVSDLRFIFGYKFNIGDALGKLMPTRTSQQ